MIYELPKLGEVPPHPTAISVETRPSGTTYTERQMVARNQISGCGSLKLFTKVAGGVTSLFHAAGTIGELSLPETNLGRLDGFYGQYFVATFSLSGADITTTVAMGDLPDPDTDSVKHVILSVVGEAGELSQAVCGATATACRNWFASEEPFYGMSITIA